jgi:hypothetical protein
VSTETNDRDPEYRVITPKGLRLAHGIVPIGETVYLSELGNAVGWLTRRGQIQQTGNLGTAPKRKPVGDAWDAPLRPAATLDALTAVDVTPVEESGHVVDGSVQSVLAYAEDHPLEIERLIVAETDGQARPTLLDGLAKLAGEHLDPTPPPPVEPPADKGPRKAPVKKAAPAATETKSKAAPAAKETKSK